MNKNSEMNPLVKQENTYGIGDNFMLSQIKVGKTTFIVSSYFYERKTFPPAMEQVIEHKIKAS